MSIVITGATGGLGSRVLQHLSALLPRDKLIGTSRDPSSVSSDLTSLASFREADFCMPSTLDTAFAGASKVLIVSTPTFDVALRNQQHRNAIDACKRAGVQRIYYTSLCFGGYASDSQMGVMASHLATEAYLKEAGVEYTVIREGSYTDAFPFFLGWYPETTSVAVSGDGPIAWACRDELAEATAKLMLEDGFKNELVLLTGPEAMTLRETTAVVSKTLGRDIEFKLVDMDEYIKVCKAQGKNEQLAQAWGSTFAGLAKGEGATVDPLLEKLLGRRPKSGREWIEETLKKDPEYRWHQNEKYRHGDNL